MGTEDHTKPRSIRIDDDLWLAAGKAAKAEGRTITDVVKYALRRYVEDKAVTGTPPVP